MVSKILWVGIALAVVVLAITVFPVDLAVQAKSAIGETLESVKVMENGGKIYVGGGAGSDGPIYRFANVTGAPLEGSESVNPDWAEAVAEASFRKFEQCVVEIIPYEFTTQEIRVRVLTPKEQIPMWSKMFDPGTPVEDMIAAITAVEESPRQLREAAQDRIARLMAAG